MSTPVYEYKTYGTSQIWDLEDLDNALPIKQCQELVEKWTTALKQSMEKK